MWLMPKPDLRKMPKIVFRKLGKEQADGQAHLRAFGDKEDKLEIDSRLRNRRKMETILHEALHYSYPELCEEFVLKSARFQALVLWKLGYRIQGPKTP